MKYFFILILFISISAFSYGQLYSSLTIPETVSKNANAVIRDYNVTIEINDNNSISYKTEIVITILNEKAKQLAVFNENYNKFSKLEFLEGYIYNKLGVEVKKIKKSDLLDFSSFDFSGFSDLRTKIYSPIINEYPVTVKYVFNYTFLSHFQLPSLTPYLWSIYNVGVEHSKFQILNLSDNIRLVENNTQSADFSETSNSKTWIFNNLPPVKEELFLQNKDDLFPFIFMAPNNFVFDNYGGSLATWNNFGKWLKLISKDRDILPPSTETYVKSLVAGITDTTEIIRTVYKYMQSKTRYVSIQLGIGGLQPFEAKFVDEVCYGDCKALSNYMVALLKVVGIKANYVVISAGENDRWINPDFPSNRFNHVIVCVPFHNDTIWLECTDQKIPFRYTGTFTDDRYALMVTDNGGELVKTPAYSLSDNLLASNVEVNFFDDGIAKVKIDNVFNGLQFEKRMIQLFDSYEEQKDNLYEILSIGDFKINSFTYSNVEKNGHPAMKEFLDLDINNFYTLSGNRLIFPAIVAKQSFTIPEATERKNDIFFKRAYSYIDTIFYNVPENYRIEFLPKELLVTSLFGSYHSEAVESNGKIIFVRRLETFSGNFEAEHYEELINFYTECSKMENQKIILMKI